MQTTKTPMSELTRRYWMTEDIGGKRRGQMKNIKKLL